MMWAYAAEAVVRTELFALMRQHSQVQCFQKVDQAQNIQDRNSRSFPLPINWPPTRWEGDPTRTKGNYTTDLSNGISEHRIETRALKSHARWADYGIWGPKNREISSRVLFLTLSSDLWWHFVKTCPKNIYSRASKCLMGQCSLLLTQRSHFRLWWPVIGAQYHLPQLFS